MKQSEFVELLAKKSGTTQKQTGEMLDCFWELIAKNLKKGDEVAFTYGKFVLKKRPARAGRNPLTGAKIKISAKVVPQFKPGKRFKDSVSA